MNETATGVFYVVMGLLSFEDALETNGLWGTRVPIKVPKGMGYPEHFIPVFTTREAAEAWAKDGGLEIAEIRLTRTLATAPEPQP